MMMREELSAVGGLEKLIATDGHAAVFERHGPTARRFYRAATLWKNASILAGEGKGVEAARHWFHSMYLSLEQACAFTMYTPKLMERGVNAALTSIRQCCNELTDEQKEYADLSLQVQSGPLIAQYMLAFSRGAEAARALERLQQSEALLRQARLRYAATGTPSLPRAYDPWAYDVIEGENAGLDPAPAPKERFCAGLLDNELLAFILERQTLPMQLARGESAYPKIKEIAQEMCQLAPTSTHGWHQLGLMEARTKNYAAAATAYETACNAARDDELEHKTLLRYCHIEAILFRGDFYVRDVRALVEEARALKAKVRPLRLDAGSHSRERSRVDETMRGLANATEDAYVERGVTELSYKTEEERLAKMEQLQKEIGTPDTVLVSGPGTTERKPALGLASCACCQHQYDKLLRCSRCKAIKYCSPTCQKKHWPTHKATCQAVSK